MSIWLSHSPLSSLCPNIILTEMPDLTTLLKITGLSTGDSLPYSLSRATFPLLIENMLVLFPESLSTLQTEGKLHEGRVCLCYPLLDPQCLPVLALSWHAAVPMENSMAVPKKLKINCHKISLLGISIEKDNRILKGYVHSDSHCSIIHSS